MYTIYTYAEIEKCRVNYSYLQICELDLRSDKQTAPSSSVVPHQVLGEGQQLPLEMKTHTL